MKNKLVIFVFVLLFTASSCDLINSSSEDTTPPGEISSIKLTPNDGNVEISWVNPEDSDFDSVEISYNGILITTSGETFNATGLTNGVEYSFTLKSKDITGNYSEGVVEVATPNTITITGSIWEILGFSTTGYYEFNSNGAIAYQVLPNSTMHAAMECEVVNDKINIMGEEYQISIIENLLKLTSLGGSPIFFIRNTTFNKTSSIPRPDPDLIPPAEVTNLNYSNNNGVITITWVNPTDIDLEYISIESINGGYSSGSSSYGTTCILDDLTIDTEYTITVKSVDIFDNESTGITFNVTPTSN